MSGSLKVLTGKIQGLGYMVVSLYRGAPKIGPKIL